MNLALPAEAAEFGAAAEKALVAAGGVDLARRAEADPTERERAGAALESLGFRDLDPRADLGTAAAAGELCRAAGRVGLPYPLVPVLLRDPGSGEPLAVVDPAPPAGSWKVDHADLFPDWCVRALSGAGGRAHPEGERLATRLGPFVARLVPSGAPAGVGSGAPAGPAVDLYLVLGSWWVLGCVERALELAVDHVGGRVQFGQTLSSFQAVQFQLADVATAVDGLRELCRFTMWRLFSDPDRARPDALALRVHAIDVARAGLRTCQQLHGAAGVCDEYDVSVLCRHVQPVIRLPFSAERAVEELAGAVAADGFSGLFPHGGDRGRPAAAGAGTRP